MLRVTTEFTGTPGAPYFSTMHFGGTDTTVAQEAVAAVGDFWSALAGSQVDSLDWTTQSDVEVIDEATGNLLEVFNTTPETGAGTVTSDAMPPANQGLVRWRTGQIAGGRELRGRTFLPGLAETNNNNGVLDPALISAVNTAAAALVAGPGNFFWIYSRTHGVAHSASSGSCWNQWAVLRSRRD